jgi:hypothetical protein
MSGVPGPTSEDGKLTPKGASLKRWKCNKSLEKSKEEMFLEKLNKYSNLHKKLDAPKEVGYFGEEIDWANLESLKVGHAMLNNTSVIEKGGVGSGKKGHTTPEEQKFKKPHMPKTGIAEHYTDYEVSPAHGELTPEGKYKKLLALASKHGIDIEGHVDYNTKTKEIMITEHGKKLKDDLKSKIDQHNKEVKAFKEGSKNLEKDSSEQKIKKVMSILK